MSELASDCRLNQKIKSINDELGIVHCKIDAIIRLLESSSKSLPLMPSTPNRARVPSLPSISRLPSTAIDKSKLQPSAVTKNKYADLVGKEGKVGTLALFLARESYFGDEVMSQCTAHGQGDKPGLPFNELMQLKEDIRDSLPQKWNSPQEIELLWMKCTEAISQGCKRARAKLQKKGPGVTSTHMETMV